jgi:hypothetical protein
MNFLTTFSAISAIFINIASVDTQTEFLILNLSHRANFKSLKSLYPNCGTIYKYGIWPVES